MKTLTKLALGITATAACSALASHFVTKTVLDKNNTVVHDETDVVSSHETLKDGILLSVEAKQTKRPSRIMYKTREEDVLETIVAESRTVLMPVVKSALRRISRDYRSLLRDGKTHNEAITILNSRQYAGLTDLKIS